MKKIIYVSLLFCLSLLLFGCKEKVGNTDNVDEVFVNRKLIKLKKNDEVSTDFWNGEENYYNDQMVHSIKFYNNIKIGDSINDVIKKFNIKSGYAYINAEVPNEEGDGTTDIIDKEYKNRSSFNFDYLDACIIIGYKKVNDKWVMMNYNELDKSFDETNKYLYYYIDINGFNDEAVPQGHVISISVAYR